MSSPKKTRSLVPLVVLLIGCRSSGGEESGEEANTLLEELVK